ncbi:hypothetical protein RBB50_009160 [Rhinocladiella similis]
MSSIPDDTWEDFLRDDSFMDFPNTVATSSNIANNPANPFTDNGNIDFNSVGDFASVDYLTDVSSGLAESNGGYQCPSLGQENTIAINGCYSGYPDYSNSSTNPALIEGYRGYPSFDVGQSNNAEFNFNHAYGTQDWNISSLPAQSLSSMQPPLYNGFQARAAAESLAIPDRPDSQPVQGALEVHSCQGSGAFEPGSQCARRPIEPIDVSFFFKLTLIGRLDMPATCSSSD